MVSCRSKRPRPRMPRSRNAAAHYPNICQRSFAPTERRSSISGPTSQETPKDQFFIICVRWSGTWGRLPAGSPLTCFADKKSCGYTKSHFSQDASPRECSSVAGGEELLCPTGISVLLAYIHQQRHRMSFIRVDSVSAFYTLPRRISPNSNPESPRFNFLKLQFLNRFSLKA